MESIILVIVTGAMCIWSFIVGAKVGQAVRKGEDIKTPAVNPMEVYRAHQTKKEEQMVQDRYNAILRNIDNYDGTGNGQEAVPGR